MNEMVYLFRDTGERLGEFEHVIYYDEAGVEYCANPKLGLRAMYCCADDEYITVDPSGARPTRPMDGELLADALAALNEVGVDTTPPSPSDGA